MIKPYILIVMTVVSVYSADIEMEKTVFLASFAKEYKPDMEDSVFLKSKENEMTSKLQLNGSRKANYHIEGIPIEEAYSMVISDIPSRSTYNRTPIFHYRVITNMSGEILYIGRRYTEFTE